MADYEMLRPAMLGGPQAVTLDVKAANRWPILTEEDRSALMIVLEDGDLSCHPVTRQLEDDYRQFFGVRHALAHSNGTAALLAAFFALDLCPGDEVIVPSATHWASVIPMLWVGAVPVFCESEPERMGLDPEDLERKITPRARAMVVVHLFGMPSKMTELLAIAGRHNLKVVEDASHALGATWRGHKCGALGDISALSLQTSKLAPAGEGGILLTNNDEYFERAVCLGDVERIRVLETAAARFAGTSFGIKTRLSPLSAAVGRVQLRHLPERNAKRNENLLYLSEHLERFGFQTFLPPAHIQRVYFEYLIRYDVKRWGMPIEVLVEALAAEGCEVAWPRYPLLHQQPIFTEGHFARIARIEDGRAAYPCQALPETEALSRELLRLPTFPMAGVDLLDQYVQAFEKVLWHADKITAVAAERQTVANKVQVSAF